MHIENFLRFIHKYKGKNYLKAEEEEIKFIKLLIDDYILKFNENNEYNKIN